MSKSLFASKTFWANLIVALLGGAAALTDAGAPVVTSEWFLTGVGLLNIVLRMVTTQPVTASGTAAK